jgi:hypothetical protein
LCLPSIYQFERTGTNLNHPNHDFNHKPDYISLKSKKIASKDQKRGMSKKKSAIWVEFFPKIVKRTGSNNCEQGGKKLQNS